MLTGVILEKRYSRRAALVNLVVSPGLKAAGETIRAVFNACFASSIRPAIPNAAASQR
jgi:hypothetical protein